MYSIVGGCAARLEHLRVCSEVEHRRVCSEVRRLCSEVRRVRSDVWRLCSEVVRVCSGLIGCATNWQVCGKQNYKSNPVLSHQAKKSIEMHKRVLLEGGFVEQLGGMVPYK